MSVSLTYIGFATFIDDDVPRYTAAENTAVNTTVNVTDADLLDVLTCAVATQPSHGVTASANDFTQPRLFTYTPAESYAGNDTFTVTCKDQSNAEATVTVTMTVVSINDAAFAADAPPSTVTATIAASAKAAYDSWRTALSSTASFATDEQALRAAASAGGDAPGSVARGDTMAWHLSGGDVSWADGISTQTRYLIALLGYDHESSNAATASTTTTLTYNITSVPAFGTLYLASPAAAAGAVVDPTAAIDEQRFSAASVSRGAFATFNSTSTFTVTSSPAAEPALLWYVPSETSGQTVGRAGWVEIRWTVSDGGAAQTSCTNTATARLTHAGIS